MLTIARLSPVTSAGLEDFARGAGQALACPFSNSDEYEAALIAERRAQGRYGRRRALPLWIVAAVVAALGVLAAIII